MQDKGWVKLHRTILDSWVFTDPTVYKIWTALILLANHKPAKVYVKGHVINLERGQFFTSYRSLAEKLKMSTKTVQRALKLFTNDGMIIVDSIPNVGTTINVLNYSTFQGKNEDDGNSAYHSAYHSDDYSDDYTDGNYWGTHSTTEQELKNNIKECKELKNERKEGGHPHCDPWGNVFE